MRFAILIILAFLPSYLLAANISHDAWYGYFAKRKLSENYSWWTEAQLRYDFDDSTTQQTLFRTGLLRKLTESSEAGLLYAFIQTGISKEHRFAFQHVQKYGEFLNADSSHRIRLEFRSREQQSNLSERFRYLIRFQEKTDNVRKFVIWDELFINLQNKKGSQSKLLERNRLFVGYQFSNSQDFKIELGYLNQFVSLKSEDQMEHILALYLFL